MYVDEAILMGTPKSYYAIEDRKYIHLLLLFVS